MSETKKRFSLLVDQKLHSDLVDLAQEQNKSVASLYTMATKKILKEHRNNYSDSFYNLNIERAILSAILFDSKTLSEITSRLTQKDFYLPFHQYVFEAMKSLEMENQPIDEEFIKSKLLKLDKFDEMAFLDIMASNPITNLEAYIDDLLERSNRRKLSSSILNFRQKLHDTPENSFKIQKDLQIQLDNLEDTRNPLVKPISILDVEEEEIFFYTKDWLPIPKQAITIIGGVGGAAKSAVVLQLLMKIIQENPNEKIFGWLSEDLKGYTKERFSGFKNAFFRNENLESFKKLDIAGSGDIPFFILNVSSQGITVNEKWYQFKAEMKDYDIVVLDPLIAFFGGEENSNTHARFFMNLLNEWVAKENKTLIIIHHSKKVGGKDTRDDITIRGAGAIVDAARLAYEIKSVSLSDYENDYRLFNGYMYTYLPKNIKDENSEGYSLARSAILTHRRIFVAKDNLGVKLLMSEKSNKNGVFYLQAWGEKNDYKVIYENASSVKESQDFSDITHGDKENVRMLMPMKKK